MNNFAKLESKKDSSERKTVKKLNILNYYNSNTNKDESQSSKNELIIKERNFVMNPCSFANNNSTSRSNFNEDELTMNEALLDFENDNNIVLTKIKENEINIPEKQNVKSRRKRTAFTSTQLIELEKEFIAKKVWYLLFYIYILCILCI